MNNKLFIKLFFCLSLISSIVLFYLSFLGYSNDRLAKYSEERVEQSKNEKSEIVFVGDSSLKYGLDEKYFSTLLNNKSVSNLALTAGAHNISATFNMIRNIIKNNDKIKYIVIMQNPSIWQYPFSDGGYCSTLDNLSNEEVIAYKFLDNISCFKYKYMNLKSIKKAFKKEKKSRDEEETYKNGLLNINEELNNNKYIDYELINSSKNKEFKMLDDYLQDKNVKVFYIQGTLHYDLYQKYSNVIDEQHKILREFKNITFIEKYLYPINENMGNAENHVHSSYKLESTKFFYEILKDYLK